MILATKKMINRSCRFVLLLTLLLGMLSAIGVARAHEHYEVVVNANVTARSLPSNSLRAIFGMRQQTWPDGTAIKVFVLADDAPLHSSFCKEKLSAFPYQLRQAWDRMVFSGTGQAPTRVSSSEEMFDKVASTPGAIGYLEKSKISERINVLQIK
ncbi:MAG: hypothetical protein NTW90_01300 [Nitrosospira sp.]|nr:hypothetical protein [Nitrosospira sp.]